jgi:hypothetical protein
MRIGPGGNGSLLADMGMWDTPVWIRRGDGMRALKIAVVVMGVLIVAGTMALVIGVARRSSAPVAPLPASMVAVLDEPAGTRIAGIVAVQDRLAVQLQGGGVDRVVLVDPRTGAVAGRVSLSR